MTHLEGHDVTIELIDGTNVRGSLRKMTPEGITLYRNQGLENGNMFYPMHRVQRVVSHGVDRGF